jgi:hypothetical protein
LQNLALSPFSVEQLEQITIFAPHKQDVVDQGPSLGDWLQMVGHGFRPHQLPNPGIMVAILRALILALFLSFPACHAIDNGKGRTPPSTYSLNMFNTTVPNVLVLVGWRSWNLYGAKYVHLSSTIENADSFLQCKPKPH